MPVNILYLILFFVVVISYPFSDGLASLFILIIGEISAYLFFKHSNLQEFRIAVVSIVFMVLYTIFISSYFISVYRDSSKCNQAEIVEKI